MTIDEVARERWPDGSVDLLFVDAEGAEEAVLEGAWGALSEGDPIVVVEVSEENIEEDGGPVVRLMEDLRFPWPSVIQEDGSLARWRPEAGASEMLVFSRSE